MTQNDFYVAIQFVLEKALEEGWKLGQIEDYAIDAVDEFVGVHESIENGDEE